MSWFYWHVATRELAVRCQRATRDEPLPFLPSPLLPVPWPFGPGGSGGGPRLRHGCHLRRRRLRTRRRRRKAARRGCGGGGLDSLLRDGCHGVVDRGPGWCPRGWGGRQARHHGRHPWGLTREARPAGDLRQAGVRRRQRRNAARRGCGGGGLSNRCGNGCHLEAGDGLRHGCHLGARGVVKELRRRRLRTRRRRRHAARRGSGRRCHLR